MKCGRSSGATEQHVLRKIKKLIVLSSTLKLISPAFLNYDVSKRFYAVRTKGILQHKTDGMIRDCLLIVKHSVFNFSN